MNTPLISICIPTYDRKHYLKQCLDSIVCQFSNTEVRDKVEIIISENPDKDDATQMVAEYMKKYSNIRYHKNEVNLGGGRNFLRILKMPKAKYAWLLGDDDIVSTDSLQQLIATLGDKNYSAILLNYSQGEHKDPKIKIYSNSLHLKSDKEYVDFKDFFKGDDFKNFSGINFMSALIFNVELMKMEFTKFDRFVDNLFLQTYIFLILGTHGNLLRIAKPLVTWRSGETRRYDKYQRDEAQVKSDYIGFIQYSKHLGYMFDENKISHVDHKILVKGVLFNLFKKYRILSFARLIYRIPRLVRYYMTILCQS